MPLGGVRDPDRDVVRRAGGDREAGQLRNSAGKGRSVSQHSGDRHGSDDTVESVGGEQDSVARAHHVLTQVSSAKKSVSVRQY
ncbi:hypothetical protein PSU4_46760 [Pseudonocardia sulfidoxydans NBRC 16205]|uniref:Uncharacterized protein n=1 Tax=Pseudonocardia sulfidoxydans NBRC 16205 TaxID=1223511 RepID=A0A511DLN2_9PSEU|nr:hypothetical protein PSU4_46760 [Pseudonocardia sulfidoxydans NBRC 16205]